jgi:hypothetical protein
LKLGFEISERTVSRYLARVGRKGDARKLWLIFLRNHREVIAAMDFFPVPTATFRMLYCFFVIRHNRRNILHFNVTEPPSSRWIVQQLREAFPEDSAPRYLILDRGKEVRRRSHGGAPIHEERNDPDILSKLLAEGGCRKVGGELPPRTAGSRDRVR